MGFALWIEKDTLWAAGTHEYRPMGAAVVASSSAFTPRDFSRYLKPPPRHDSRFAGLFASLGELNDYLVCRRRRHGTSKTFFVDFKPRKNRVVLEF